MSLNIDNHTNEIQYKDGKRHGLCKWFIGDRLNYEVEYRDGLKHGPVISYFADGSIHYKANCKDNKAHGPVEWYDRAGTLCDEAHYLYGKEVTEEEYRKHQLTEELSGLGGI